MKNIRVRLVLATLLVTGAWDIHSETVAVGNSQEDNIVVPLAPVAARKYTAKDYIQDGLIAMWDGIENAGWGVHDESSLIWKDLTGNWGDATISSRASWGEDALIGLSGSGFLARGSVSSKTSDDIVTIETVFKSESTNQQRIFCPKTTYNSKILQYLQVGSDTEQRALSPNGEGYNFLPSLGKITGIRVAGTLIYDDVVPYNAKYIFLNGKLKQGSERTGCNASVARGYFDIGGRADGLAWTTFLGEISCIRIYSRALTAEEVFYNYTIDKVRFNLP